MKIEELKKRYPDVKFYELTDVPSKGVKLKNLKDFLELVKVVGYVAEEIDGDEASEAALEDLITDYSCKHFSRSEVDNFIGFVEDNLTKELKKLTTCKEYTSFQLFGLDIDVMYAENHSIKADDYKIAIVELEHIREKYQAQLEEEKKNFDEKVKACIMGYKDEFEQAKNKTEKEEVIKKIQWDLKMQYGLNARSDDRATSMGIKQLLKMGFIVGPRFKITI